MLVEIYGAGFTNKGAQLMLETVVRRLGRQFPLAEFCVERESVPHGPTTLPGLQHIFVGAPRNRLRRHPVMLRVSAVAGRLVPGFIVRRRDEVARHRIDALVDISGYAFGDVLPLRFALNFRDRAHYYSKRGRPVIMLPQMLGPFGTGEHKTAMRNIYDVVDLLYARDSVSYEHVKSLLPGGCAKLQQAPDVTLFTAPEPDTPVPRGQYACIVPNIRILDRGPAEWRDHYMADLVRAARLLRDRGLRVQLIIHETAGGDLRLARQIQLEAGLDDDTVLESTSPLQLKATLGGAHLVVTSRFHAAVGALSSDVPTIVLGWAHKYDALMEDFGTPDYIQDARQEWPEFKSKLLELLRGDVQARIRATLRSRKEQMRPAAERMWKDVFAVLEIAL